MSSDPQLPKNKIWSTRFEEPVNDLVEVFTASVEFDKQLADYDISGSIAHARMLSKTNIISEKDLKLIESGLTRIRQEIKTNNFQWSTKNEDVHLNIEKRLIELVGDAGKKLHTARSRNDQVVTDFRLFLRDSNQKIIQRIRGLQVAVLDLAEKNVETVMPGFTHLQVAQPVSFGHHLMAYYEMLKRDKERLSECHKRINTLPLGAAALAGTTYPIDRAFVAHELGFNNLCANSIDSVSDRDFAIEFCSASAIIMMHLSRFSEEIILWMNQSFNFITLPDSLCTGSSIMPQKKNPDVPELIRGKTGRTNGNLIALLTVMKGQPLAYNRDNQEDKEPVFDTVNTVSMSLAVFEEIVKGISVNKKELNSALRCGFATATDLADYLVKKGIPFRESHAIVGQIVRFADREGLELSEIPQTKMKEFSPFIENDISQVLEVSYALNSRNHIGGTAPSQVQSAIEKAREEVVKSNI